MLPLVARQHTQGHAAVMSTDPIPVVAICGSLRRNSLNRRLLEAAIRLAPAELDIAVQHIDRIPPYNADLEKDTLPVAVRRLKQAVDDSQGLLLVTPEYNASIPGVLKNALDWASRPAFRSPLVGKPVAMMAGTPGRRGAQRALDELRQVLQSTLAEPLALALDVPQIHEKLRGHEIVNDELAASVSRLMAQLAAALRDRVERPADDRDRERIAS